MKKVALLLVIILSICSCGSGNKENTDKETTSDTLVNQVDTSSEPEKEKRRSRWVPEKFIDEHYDEWVVVEHAIAEQQRGDKRDYNVIDSFVRAYIYKREIPLPSDVRQEILVIDSVCKHNFDFSDYDYTNWGMMVAESTKQLFENYIIWLYGNEAKKVAHKYPYIDIERELNLFGNLYDAMFNVCDTVEGRFNGSAGHFGWEQLYSVRLSFERDFYKSILGVKNEQLKQMDVSKLFDEECQLYIENCDPVGYCSMDTAVILIERFRNNFHVWYNYRQKISSKISNRAFKTEYDKITNGYARKIFIHLKNRFFDIKQMDVSIWPVLMHDENTNEEILNFSFEDHFGR